MSDWSRLVNSTISKYIKGEEINILRNRKLLAMMKSKGRISFNWSGLDMVWRVRYKRSPMQGYADGDTLTFPRRDKRKTATLPYRGYSATDSMNKMEKLKNRSTEAIIDLASGLAEEMMEDIGEAFSEEFYQDGNASGHTKGIHGIESYMGTSGQTRAYVSDPSDSYAGLNTDLGSYGGSWTTSATWPRGTGDAHFDFWSPILVNYTAAAVGGVGWQNATPTWINTCVEAIRFGIINAMRSKSKKGMLDTIFLEGDLYRLFLERLDERTRIQIQSNNQNSTLIKLGFGDVQNLDGCDVTTEFGLPANIGYGFNFDVMELRSMQSQLFVADEPDWDLASRNTRFAIDFLGNLVSNPRSALKFKNYT
jgi:hypothetical protein